MTDHVPAILDAPERSRDPALKRGAGTQQKLRRRSTVRPNKDSAVNNAILERIVLQDLAAIERTRGATMAEKAS